MKTKEISTETRVLLAFALSALVLILFAPLQRWLAPPPPPKTPPPQAEAPGGAGVPPASRPKASPEPPKAERPRAQAEKEPRQAERETETTVENDLYRVVFSNRGAVVKSWVLKKYRDNAGRPLELLNPAAAAQAGHPFLVSTDDRNLRDRLWSALFHVKATGTNAPATVTFEYSDGTVSARKEFRFEHASYVVSVTSEVRSEGARVSHELMWRGGFGDQTVPEPQMAAQVFTAAPGIVERRSYGELTADAPLGGGFLYAGIEDAFFTAAFMPSANAGASSALTRFSVFRNEFKRAEGQPPVLVVGVGAAAGAENQMRVFVGPKDLDVLARVYPSTDGAERARRGEPVLTLAELVDYGWFTFIAKPLAIGLKWIYSHMVPNYGWAIVLLTIVINMVLFPLKLKSMKSALKMQKLAPQIKAIQEKYRKMKLTDPKRQQQNQEVMDLYKKHGVNPMGACLPMLLQIPFLYGFYKVLSVSIEMRHAPWFGWIRDLSAKDPYYVLPVVMTVTMFILQKMTPQTTTDPMQQKMFLYMPLMFGFMFMNVSSGLVLYWLVGNVVGIAQQWYINKSDLGAAVGRKPATGAERSGRALASK